VSSLHSAVTRGIVGMGHQTFIFGNEPANCPCVQLDANRGTECHQSDRVAQYQAPHLPLACSQRDPHSNFLDALCRHVGDQPARSDGGKYSRLQTARRRLLSDLAEERQPLGWMWYWLHVLRVTFVLWRSASTEAPLRMLAIALAACVLFTAPAFAGVAAVLLFPLLVGSAASWITLSLFWWGGALWAGASLVTIAPRRGMATCAIVAVIAAALVIAVGTTTEPRELSSPVAQSLAAER
jgi:hypothetical protein